MQHTPFSDASLSTESRPSSAGARADHRFESTASASAPASASASASASAAVNPAANPPMTRQKLSQRVNECKQLVKEGKGTLDLEQSKQLLNDYIKTREAGAARQNFLPWAFRFCIGYTKDQKVQAAKAALHSLDDNGVVTIQVLDQNPALHTGLLESLLQCIPSDKQPGYKLVIHNGVVIGITCCKKEDLIHITLPDGVTRIGECVFAVCTGLRSLTLPEGLRVIYSYAFQHCTGLTSLVFPAVLEKIGGAAFSGCKSITSLTLPEGLSEIRRNAFEGCRGLTSITFPAGLREIGTSAFEGCIGLRSIYLTEAVFKSLLKNGSNLQYLNQVLVCFTKLSSTAIKLGEFRQVFGNNAALTLKPSAFNIWALSVRRKRRLIPSDKSENIVKLISEYAEFPRNSPLIAWALTHPRDVGATRIDQCQNILRLITSYCQPAIIDDVPLAQSPGGVRMGM